MSFRLFIYYCALCGGWAGLLGWGLGRLLVRATNLDPNTQTFQEDILMGLSLGTLIGLGIGIADTLANSGGGSSSQVMMRVAIRGVATAALGLGAGLVGTALGSALAHVQDLFQLLGWVLVGLLIGASVGGVEILARLISGENVEGAVRRLINGLIGGGLGGLLGGGLFIAARSMLAQVLKREATELVSGTAWGFAALGACIGLLIGLAQVILKEAWVKVEVGFRAGRELILSKKEITVGRGEGCDIGLFGDSAAEKLHARIIQKNNRYLVADAGTPGGTYVNGQRVTEPLPLRDGDAIRVGNSILRFGERAKRKN